MTKIFISYSRVDETFTKELAELLREVYGYDNIWYDAALHQRGGVKWWDTILDKIADSDIFLFLLSNESVQSPFCQAEFTEAQRLNKHIVTVQVRDRTQIPPELSEIQYVDMKRGLHETRSYNNLITSINNMMQQPMSKRAKWQGRTPKPSTNTEPEKIDREEVTTPELFIALPPEAHQRKQSGGNWVIAAAIGLLLVLLLSAGIFFANLGNNANPTAEPTLEATNTLPPVEASLTAIFEQATQAAIETQSMIEPSQTRLAEIPLTSQAVETNAFIETEVALRLATQITHTPSITPTITETEVTLVEVVTEETTVEATAETTAESTTESVVASATLSPTPDYCTVRSQNRDGSNIRVSPNTDANVTGSVSYTGGVRVDGRYWDGSYYWYRIGSRGWVRSDTVYANNYTICHNVRIVYP